MLAARASPATPVAAGGADSPTPVPNTIVVVPTGAEASPTATPAAMPPVIEIVASGFGQPKPGGPVTVAARIRNDGPAEDLVPASITVFDANGVVIAAGGVTLH
jgi:hypothetical protein